MAPRLLVAALLGVTACSGGSGSGGQGGAEGGVPEIASLELSPQPVYAGNTITVFVRPKNTGGPAVRYAYQWHKNGEGIEGAIDNTLPNTFFQKGDTVTVTVTPKNGLQEGMPMMSKPVVIKNSAPVVTAVGMAPAPLYHRIAVQSVAQSSDVDGDAVTYSYRWFRNDAIIPDQTNEMLDGELFGKGDRIQVQVTPSDGEATGAVRISPPITVRNSPPRITSQPTTLLNEDDTYLYQVVAEDGDGDSILYSLTSAPQGMTIDPERGLIHWNVSVKDQGIHPIEITVANADGAKTMQQYDLRIDDLTGQSTPPPPQASRTN